MPSRLVAALAVLVPAAAAANPLPYPPPTYVPGAPGPAEADAPFVFVAPHVGFAAPTGLFGVEGGVGIDWFRGAIGAGLGLRSPQLAATARAVTSSEHVDLGIGVGISHGAGSRYLHVGYDTSGEPDEYVEFGSSTLWGNLELLVELQTGHGTFVRGYAGVGYALAPDCEVDPRAYEAPVMPCLPHHRAELDEDRWMPYLGVAVGVRVPGPPRTRGHWQFAPHRAL